MEKGEKWKIEGKGKNNEKREEERKRKNVINKKF